MATRRTIRFAAVGGGQITQTAFIPALAQLDDAELVALVTGDPRKAEALGHRYNIRCYSYDDYDALLASGTIDAVYIATPNFLHRQYAVPALERGIHVLLEKPMATSVNDCLAIMQAQQDSGAQLMVAYRLHQEPTTVEMIARVRRGELGRPVMYTAAFGQDVDEDNHRAKHGYWSGPVPDLGIYPLNEVRHLFDEEPIKVTAQGVRTPGRHFSFDDTVTVTLTFPSQRIATFSTTFAGASVDTFTLVGTEGTISASPCFTFGPDAILAYRLTRHGQSFDYAHGPHDQFGGELRYFIDCLQHGIAPEPDGEEGLFDVVILEAIERALQTGLPQSLPTRQRRQRILSTQARALPPVQPPEALYVVTQENEGV
ncbi:Gfo/Idh/MocA family protein [Zymobacter sp. IVIA_5232.4 C2]|uniref:Gfo/Idh/MocA family protein n=1 Tax=Zymobacter sp. IVIA_5232.4 C2 TaxID=3394855 RepID=UPI0039C24F06